MNMRDAQILKTTPRPWRLTDNKIVSTVAWILPPNESDGEVGIPVTVINLTGACGGEDGDLPFILQACNQYDGLIAVLRGCVADLAAARGDRTLECDSYEALARDALKNAEDL